MKKCIEVKEFDSIIAESSHAQNSGYVSIGKNEFDNLIHFIREFTSGSTDSDVLDYMRVSYKRNLGDVVTMKNYVGLIQMNNGFQIQVLPKIVLSGDDTNNQITKEIFLKMLRSMKDFPSKSFNQASLKADRMNLYEIFINMYLQEVRRLLKIGLKSDYINCEDNLNVYKGKLIIKENIRHNMTHKERFYVSYDEFSSNRPENKIIKATIEKLQKITVSSDNAKLAHQLLAHFDGVDSSINYDKDFSKVVSDRNTASYGDLMRWSKVFLYNKSFTTFSGDTNARALLFPMESVFESYVAREIRKQYAPNGWRVDIQGRGKYLFEEPSKRFALRPDIVLRKNDRTIILDTKWKQLVDNPRVNYGISQVDMYQMYAYSKKYNASEIYLLYPMSESMRNKEKIVYDSGDGTVVNVCFIDLREKDILIPGVEAV